MNKQIFGFIILLSVIITNWACKSKNDAPELCTSELNQEGLFQNLADQLIIPRYQDFQVKVNSLKTKTEAFLATPDLSTLNTLQQAFQDAYISWQYVAQYEFGPADDINLRATVNNFPADTAAIQSNIVAGKTDLSQPEAFDRGFPAIDFLLFGIAETDAEILAKYVDDTAQKVHYQAYLKNIADNVHAKTVQVIDQWTNGGYRDNFIANIGTAAGASLSLIINALNEHYEIIRRDKLGIPVGALTLGFANPDKTEAFFAGISAQLALTSTQAAQELYLGKGVDGTNREGLDDYLQQISEKSEGVALHQTINQQFDLAIAALTGLPDPLASTIESDQAKVEAAYAEIVKQVVNIKTDMPSLLCVAITYVDNPSDSD